MSNWPMSIADLQQKRAAILYQLSVEETAYAQFPGFQLDEFCDLRLRLYEQIDEIDRTLARLQPKAQDSKTSFTLSRFLKRLAASIVSFEN